MTSGKNYACQNKNKEERIKRTRKRKEKRRM
jgi:hypothetical protein